MRCVNLQGTTLVNLKKNSIIYATIYYYVFICRRSNEGGG